MTLVRVAAAQYPIEQPGRLADYLHKLTGWCEAAALAGAQILVFPEYAGAEAMAVVARSAEPSLARGVEALQDVLPEAWAHLEREGRRLGVVIVGPSAPVLTHAGCRNRLLVFGPDGVIGEQDKLVPTPWDREVLGVGHAEAPGVFETTFGRVGIAICYDVEFPLIGRALVEAGAEVIVAPSCTDTLAGYGRVRIGARARALEGQCAVVQAPTVGAAAWTSLLDVNRGAAGVFVPPDEATTPDGVLASGRLDEPAWVHAEVDTERLAAVRAAGEVRTYAHWDEQPNAPARLIGRALRS